MLIRGLALASTVAAAATFASGLNGVSAQPDLEPMIFFVAKGEPNACGPGCSEWIAAEGYFEGRAVEHRFRELLDSLKGRDLPIFFNSFGGRIGAGRLVGRILRERRMRAGVGESFPEGCRARNTRDESCRRIMQSSRELKAELRISGAVCHSACIDALIGASERHVPAGARLGIHAPAPSPESLRPGAPTAQQLDSDRKRYVLEMGVNPGLVDASAKAASNSLHILSRDEIAQFGIETRSAYETDWFQYEEPLSKRQFMLKAITQARGPDGKEFRTTNLRIGCAEGRPGTWLTYQRELSSNEVGVAAVIRVAVGGKTLVLQRGASKDGTEQHAVIADRDFIPRVLAMGSIVFTETFSPRTGRGWSREVKVSAAGLEQALDTSLKSCGKWQ